MLGIGHNERSRNEVCRGGSALADIHGVGGDDSEVAEDGEEDVGEGIHFVLVAEWFDCVYDVCWMLLNA
jgi:hypothetical protein